jgi:outer membrane protein assembly factor BamA
MVIGGDYKLQYNSELRFPIFAKFTGATFMDVGNIWTKDTLLVWQSRTIEERFLQ